MIDSQCREDLCRRFESRSDDLGTHQGRDPRKTKNSPHGIKYDHRLRLCTRGFGFLPEHSRTGFLCSKCFSVLNTCPARYCRPVFSGCGKFFWPMGRWIEPTSSTSFPFLSFSTNLGRRTLNTALFFSKSFCPQAGRGKQGGTTQHPKAEYLILNPSPLRGEKEAKESSCRISNLC